jgi:putative peptidoglycan lipid II flippase
VEKSSQDRPPSKEASAGKLGGIMVVAIFIGRILGMLRDSVITSKFGIGIDADSFKLAVSVPDIIFMLVAGGGLSSAFIPVFGDLFYREKKKEAWAAFSVVVCVMSVIAVALIAVAWIFADRIVGVLAHGSDPAVIPRAVHMSRILLPAQYAFLIGSLFIATLYVRKKFWVGGLAPNIYSLFTVMAGLILPAVAHLGIESMAWGALVGAMLGNLVLPIGAMIANKSHFTPSFNLKTPGVERFFRLLLPVIVGFSLPSMVTLITNKFASEYGVHGTNMVLGSANNLMQAPLGIFGQALAMGVFPILAECVANKRMDLYREQVSKTLRTVLYLGIPSGALMFALSPEIAHALYGIGKASQDYKHLAQISDCLRCYAVGIFAWCMQPVLMRGFFSLHKTFKPIAISTGATILFIALCELAVNSSPDFRMIPFATDVSIFVLVIALYITLEKDVGRLDLGGILATILLCGIASVAAGAAAYGMMLLFHPTGELARVCDLLLVATVAAWVYYFATRLMKVPETSYVDRAINKISGKLTGSQAKPR